MAQLRDLRLLVSLGRQALSMTQRQYGEALGASHRTAVRWDGGGSVPSLGAVVRLARLLHPVDRSLAVEVAAHAHETMESLGLEVPPPPVVAAPPPAVAATPGTRRDGDSFPVHLKDLVDVLVLAAVVGSGQKADDVRRWLHAVVKRGCDVGLTMEDAERGLRPATTPQSVTE